MAERTGAAGRDHAAADVVAVSYQQDFILGADHDRAADGSGGAEPRAKNVGGIGIDELFLQEPHSIGMTAGRHIRAGAGFCYSVDWTAVLRVIEPLFPKKLRARRDR